MQLESITIIKLKPFIENLYKEYSNQNALSLTTVDIFIELDKKNIIKLNPEIKNFLTLFSSLNIKSNNETTYSTLLKKFLKQYNDPNLLDLINFLDNNSSFFEILKIYFDTKDIKNILFKKDHQIIKEKKKEEDNVKIPEFLEKYGRNLTKLAKENKLNKVIGREEELQRLVQILLKKTKNNPILIGEPGVGKTAIVEGLAYKIANNEIKELQNKQIIELTVSSILSGTSLRGELEKKLEDLIKQLENNENIILFIDEIHTIMLDNTISNVLKPALARGQITIIGATTTEEYYKYIEKDPALERRFQPILVNEPTIEQTLQILENIIPSFEEHHNVKYNRDMLFNLIKLSQRYITNRNLPDKVIDIIDEVATYVKTEKNKNTIDLEDVKEVISKQTGIPISKMDQTETQKIAKLEELLKSKIIGQDEAIEKVSKIIKIAKAGLNVSKRPYGVFLFLGPTGVGKTYFAKVLAEIIFSGPDDIIRLDMSEFKEKHEVAKLLGAPPGYIGYEKDGILTLAIKKNPYTIILLDEIEKAHPEVFDIFLQVFDEGYLKDSKGRTLVFYDTVIIMTSNIGSNLIFNLIKEDPNISNEKLKEKLIPEVLKFLRPEILNRIDEVIVFKPLDKESVIKIIDLELKEISKKIEESGGKLIFTDKIKEYILDNGFDSSFGARNIKRFIQSKILATLAEEILFNPNITGNTLVIDIENEKITVKPNI
ncbi:MAG: ATP-dependent Clp protease ATP-binding subunit [bacterium]|nr:ATP-dependent Clp protease ATP-binding subunit [bacterium]